MPRGPTAPAARLRGAATGALTAALSVAAHSTAGGELPSGATVALLTVLAVTLGAFVAAMREAADFRVLVIALSAGQLLAHGILGAAGHSHSLSPGAPAGPMVAAHVVAIALGAALIAVGGRLCAAVSRALRTARQPGNRPILVRSTTVVGSTDQPLQSALRLAASVSHRGPPVSFVR